MDIFNRFSTISNYLMDHTFKDLTGLILKVGLFPTPEVLECCARYLELHLMISMKVIHKGYVSFIRNPELILSSGKRQFFLSNNAKVDQLNHPFGDRLAEDHEFQAWSEGLKVGDEVDAVKFCKHDYRGVWSRAVVTQIVGYKIFVRFRNDSSKLNQNRSMTISPFTINKPNTRSLDFEWRENLAKGDHIDYYLGRKGWLFFEIAEVHVAEFPETGEQVKTLECRLSGYDDDVYSSDEEAGQFGKKRLIKTSPSTSTTRCSEEAAIFHKRDF